jgi:hypothetical protein
MSVEMWGTIASVGTFVVIAATAIAAFVQLRHIRRANELAGLLSTFAMLQDPSVREMVNYVRHALPERMKDADFRASLLEIPSIAAITRSCISAICTIISGRSFATVSSTNISICRRNGTT